MDLFLFKNFGSNVYTFIIDSIKRMIDTLNSEYEFCVQKMEEAIVQQKEFDKIKMIIVRTTMQTGDAEAELANFKIKQNVEQNM